MIEGRVSGVRRATPSSRILRVSVPRSFAYRAGQAVEIGPIPAAVLAPYSIASAPEDTARDGILEFLVKLDANGRWGEHFEAPRRGQRLRLRGPRGAFTFPEHPSERRFLFIAGGTGIAPVRSMIRHARASVRGRIRVLYSARTPLDFAYRQELCGMARRGEIELTLTATRAVAHEPWRGERGRILATQLAALLDDEPSLCFVCGPATMVDEVPKMLRDLGVERGRIRIEEW